MYYKSLHFQDAMGINKLMSSVVPSRFEACSFTCWVISLNHLNFETIDQIQKQVNRLQSEMNLKSPTNYELQVIDDLARFVHNASCL